MNKINRALFNQMKNRCIMAPAIFGKLWNNIPLSDEERSYWLLFLATDKQVEEYERTKDRERETSEFLRWVLAK